MRNFYNSKEDIVSDAIDGLIAASGGRLRRFDPDSYARVVVRSDWDKSKVAVISGGGSGHGRSSNLESRSLNGIADPGAEGIARIIEAIAKS